MIPLIDFVTSIISIFLISIPGQAPLSGPSEIQPNGDGEMPLEGPSKIQPNGDLPATEPPLSGPSKIQPNGNQSPTQDPSTQEQQGWLTYEDAIFGMKVDYPADWTREDLVTGVRFDVPDGDNVTMFQLTSNVYDGPGAPPTPKSQIRDSADLHRRVLPDYRVISANSTELGGLPAEQAVYYYTREPVDDTAYTSTKIIAVQDDNIYAVSYISRSDDYDRLLPTFEKMAESVVIQ
jgi:hypothetical protein